ncbi:MAG: hypothetical protein ACJ73L_05610 [Actinomycetes bacterium]
MRDPNLTSVVVAELRVCDCLVWSRTGAAEQDTATEVDGWTVVTLAGTERVNAEGEGSRLVPLDPEMAAEFEDRGSSFVVRSTAEGIEQDLDPALDWRRFEQDLGRDYGPERGDHGPEH